VVMTSVFGWWTFADLWLTRELHGNGDVGNTADFPVNLAVIPRGWSTLLGGYRGSGAGCLR